MNRIVLVAILIIVFVGCKRDPFPKDGIKREKYIDVLVDVHIAESMFNDRKRFKIDSIESEALYMSVLEEHNVTSEQMLTTALYYSRNQKEYTKVWTDVLDKISILIEDQHAKEIVKTRTDSIRQPIKTEKVK